MKRLKLKNSFIFILALALSTPAAHAIQCVKLLKQHRAFDSVIAEISLQPGKHDSVSTKSRKVFRNTVLAEDKASHLLMEELSPFFDKLDTTTARLEERFVAKKEDARRILETSEVSWKMRDEKEPDQDFTTVTAYAGKFVLKTKSGNAVGKIRLRKYFKHKTGARASHKVTPVFDGVTALELKFGGLAGAKDGQLITVNDSSFKPRVFVSDTTIKRLQKLKPRDFHNKDIMDDLINATFELKPGYPPTIEKKREIESFFQALFYLGKQNPDLFEFETIVAYNRDSFVGKAEETDNEYQYTVDRNIRLYSPDANVNIGSLQKYLDNEPLHEVDHDYNFVEIKSPVSDRDDQPMAYQRFINLLTSLHQKAFNRGDGKFALAQTVRNRYHQNSLSSKLKTEGLFFFLVKGTANLPTPPNRKRIVEQGDLKLAIPVVRDGVAHRLILEYRPNISEGERSQVLDKVSMVDHLGRKVSLESQVASRIINAAISSKEPVDISVDDEIVKIPGIIEPDTVAQYQEFFSTFYTDFSKEEGNPREIESLHPVETMAQLQTYIKRMVRSNRISYLWSRTHRFITNSVLTIGTIGAFTYFFSASQPDAIITEPENTFISVASSEKAEAPSIYFQIVKTDDGQVNVIPLKEKPESDAVLALNPENPIYNVIVDSMEMPQGYSDQHEGILPH